jgi:hypothetical protein
MPSINIYENSTPIIAGIEAEASSHLSAFICGYSLYNKMTQADATQLGYKVFNNPNELLSVFDITVLSGVCSGFATGAGFSGGTVHDRELHSALNYLQYGGILVAATGASALNNTNLSIDSAFCEDNAKFNDVISLISLRQDCVGIVGSSAEYHNGVSSAYPTTSMAIYSMYGITGISGATSIDENFFSIIGRKTRERIYGATGTINLLMTSDVAGLMAIVDNAYGPWTPPAGIRKGEVLNFTNYEPKLSETNASTLSDSYGINSVSGIYGYPDRVFLMGDSSLEKVDSYRMHIGISRLILHIKRGIKPLLQGVLFEINNSSTRTALTNSVSSFLERILNKNGIKTYTVTCNETNNTETVINSKQLVIDISFVPYYTIESITFRYVLTQA